MEAAWRDLAGASRAVLALFALLSTLLLVSPRRAIAQEVEGPGIAPSITVPERLVQRVEQEIGRLEAEIGRGASPQIEKRVAAEEAAARSRAEFLSRYDEFARQVKGLMEEIQAKPGVLPLSRLLAVQRAWAAWQKCGEWPATKQ